MSASEEEEKSENGVEKKDVDDVVTSKVSQASESAAEKVAVDAA